MTISLAAYFPSHIPFAKCDDKRNDQYDDDNQHNHANDDACIISAVDDADTRAGVDVHLTKIEIGIESKKNCRKTFGQKKHVFSFLSSLVLMFRRFQFLCYI